MRQVSREFQKNLPQGGALITKFLLFSILHKQEIMHRIKRNFICRIKFSNKQHPTSQTAERNETKFDK